MGKLGELCSRNDKRSWNGLRSVNSQPQKREIEENNYFIKNLHLKRCLYLVSHLPQVENRASDDKITDIEFVR